MTKLNNTQFEIYPTVFQNLPSPILPKYLLGVYNLTAEGFYLEKQGRFDVMDYVILDNTGNARASITFSDEDIDFTPELWQDYISKSITLTLIIVLGISIFFFSSPQALSHSIY